MTIKWSWVLVALVVASASGERERRGSSLRGALEALQRRQRGRSHGPIMPPPDYEDIYEYLPPHAYPENDYVLDTEDTGEESAPKYIFELLDDENERSPEGAYEYKVIKKKSHPNSLKKESAFRERAQNSDNDVLRNIFMNPNDEDDKMQDRVENDAEYALLLNQLWSKYKQNNNNMRADNTEAPQGVVKLYKEKVVKKRYPDNWGPIAFKKKRSSDLEDERLNYEENKNHNYNAYDLVDNDNNDMQEEYAIAFQPIDDDRLSEILDDDQYPYDAIEKRFPVTKRSSGPYISPQQKRFALNQSKRDVPKNFRSNAGTDPKVLRDLSKIFGEPESEIIKNPVKRSSDHDETSHEIKPPNLTILSHNDTHQHNVTHDEEDSHEQHSHPIHHPAEKPLKIKKKSIDWSDYFGVDKRFKKSVSFVNDLNQDRLRKQYFDTFNREVINPVNSFRKHTNVKRNFIQPKPNEETEIQIDHTQAVAIRNDNKRNTALDNDSKLDNID
ncbi:hypothetical protein RR46_12103 [Papilio xuthus]|uniref:Prohormone-2 n=1 Tax=Papilio xuthus TaxID=66420 RepID=A0A194PQS8_PAPXU|nr:hypothetical protein RR46_12103 [Papilio xuthus]